MKRNLPRAEPFIALEVKYFAIIQFLVRDVTKGLYAPNNTMLHILTLTAVSSNEINHVFLGFVARSFSFHPPSNARCTESVYDLQILHYWTMVKALS